MEATINDYIEHRHDVVNEINRIIENDPDTFPDEFKAFDYFTFKNFSDATKDFFILTDGQYDQGIDFYTCVDNSYEIFQCKFADLDKIDSSSSPLSFDDAGLKDLETAYDYLYADQVKGKANQAAKDLRAQFISQDPESISLNLSVFGELTPDARDKFEKTKAIWISKNEKLTVNLYTWKDIILNIKAQVPKKLKIEHEFNIYDDKVFAANDYCTFVTYAGEFRDVFQKYGWWLFDLNVRSSLGDTPVNKKIVESLRLEKTRRRFHHLNNGILIVCSDFKLKKQKDKSVTFYPSIHLHNFQIINGCQTVVSINKGYNEIAGDKDKIKDFNDRCLVQVKAIQINDTEMIDQIIISSNTQNTMKPRNLKSNTSEQKDIQSKFSHLPTKWFYQRKDGQFNALRMMPLGSLDFRISDYKSESAYRVIDNENLATAWICFTGFSSEAMVIADFFKDERLYDRIFKYYPTDTLWTHFLDMEYELKYEDKLLSTHYDLGKKPSAEEYLLAYLIWIFINEYAVKVRENRATALERGFKQGTLRKNSQGDWIDSIEKRNDFLAKDNEYMINTIINSSKEVMLEMFSFIIAKKYGHGYEVSKRLLNSETLLPLVNNPDCKLYIANIMKKSKDNFLFSIYEYLKFSLINLYGTISSEYASSSRRKSYLAQPSYIKKFKKQILELNDQSTFKEVVKDWKIYGKNFVESLPEL